MNRIAGDRSFDLSSGPDVDRPGAAAPAVERDVRAGLGFDTAETYFATPKPSVWRTLDETGPSRFCTKLPIRCSWTSVIRPRPEIVYLPAALREAPVAQHSWAFSILGTGAK